jgi:hypothetical protein
MKDEQIKGMANPNRGSVGVQEARPVPVQEPVATLWQHGETGRTRITMPGDITDCDARWFKAADLYTTPPAQPAVPDAFGTREGEHPQYVQGWNDCRAEMLKGRHEPV